MTANAKMPGLDLGFWARLEDARQQIKTGQSESARECLMALASELINLEESLAKSRLRVLEKFAATYRLKCDFPQLNLSSLIGTDLSKYVKTVTRGVSLVTCCKNRNENLLKAISSWLACPEINEIVIVDWSSDVPVKEELQSAGINDVRINVIRVDDEPRWILTYAFNVGFRAAHYDKILKVDADIVLDREFFQKNRLESKSFISGDWRIAEPGQEFINGFFYVHRNDLMEIKGFNEFITTYGWDDDDIYDRLERLGLSRLRVDPATIYHLPHDDAQRIGGNSVSAESAWDELASDTRFKIRTNRFIANTMPVWNAQRRMLSFAIEDASPGYIQVRRAGKPTHSVPVHLREHAEFYAASELLSWRLGPRVLLMTPQRLRWLLSRKKFDSITKFDVELVLADVRQDFRPANAYLLVRSGLDQAVDEKKRVHVETLIREYAHQFGLSIVVIADAEPERQSLLAGEAVIGSWAMPFAGKVNELDASSLLRGLPPDTSHHVVLNVNRDLIAAVESEGKAALSRAPSFRVKKRKVYVDAQHGLGNRLRAVASGAAIANKTDRELVVVWEPDHHCECRIHDLFDYEGAVIEQSFISTAKANGMSVFNYMEIEKDAAKDAPIEIDGKRDLYFRSAYVAKSPLSDWDCENAFLRSLNPSARVMELVGQVRQPNAVGAHVRMEAGKGLDHNTYDSVENWTKEGHEQLHYWRAQSHYSRFMDRIDQLDVEGLAPTIFLAADRPEIYEEFVKRYGDRLAFLERSVYDRSREQIQYALADVLLLSRCSRLLGSTWSSFSELALRLTPNFESIEMSGKDF